MHFLNWRKNARKRRPRLEDRRLEIPETLEPRQLLTTVSVVEGDLAALTAPSPELWETQQLFSADFQSGGTPAEFSNGSVSSAPNTANRFFLGPFAPGGGGASDTTLSLMGLPAHSTLDISFDLYVIGGWDGLDDSSLPGTGNVGTDSPDNFTLNVDGIAQLATSFSNHNTPGQNRQDFGSGTAEMQTVFATSATFDITSDQSTQPTTNVFGNIQAADFQATSSASAAGLITGWNGTDTIYKSVLSNGTVDAANHLTSLGDGPYYNVHGELVARSKAELFSGLITSPVGYDESGNDLSSASPTAAWTGTNADGVSTGDHCLDWANNGVANAVTLGETTSDATWLNDSTGDCSVPQRLYAVGPAQLTTGLAFQTGASETGTLGYAIDGTPAAPAAETFDAVYQITLSLPHTATNADIAFVGSQLAPGELFGIDNVSISAQVAVPPAYVTLSSDFVGSTITNNLDGTFTWQYQTTDGPDESQIVTVTADAGGGNTNTDTFTLVVANEAPTVTATNLVVTVDEPQTAANTGSYSDPGADGITLSVSIGTITDNLDGTWAWNFDTTDGPVETQTVTVTATDSDGDSNNTTFDLQVNNLSPTVGIDAASITVAEGMVASNTGTYSDASAVDVVTVMSSIGAVVDNNDGTYSWSYATTDGQGLPQTVTVTATDDDGGSSSTTFVLQVDNVDPQFDGGADVTLELTDGRHFERTEIAINDPGTLDSQTVSIDYGDGSSLVTSTLAPWDTFDLDHIYQEPGTYSVQITVTDKDGGFDVDDVLVVVPENIVRLTSDTDVQIAHSQSGNATSLSPDGLTLGYSTEGGSWTLLDLPTGNTRTGPVGGKQLFYFENEAVELKVVNGQTVLRGFDSQTVLLTLPDIYIPGATWTEWRLMPAGNNEIKDYVWFEHRNSTNVNWHVMRANLISGTKEIRLVSQMTGEQNQLRADYRFHEAFWDHGRAYLLHRETGPGFNSSDWTNTFWEVTPDGAAIAHPGWSHPTIYDGHYAYNHYDATTNLLEIRFDGNRPPIRLPGFGVNPDATNREVANHHHMLDGYLISSIEKWDANLGDYVQIGARVYDPQNRPIAFYEVEFQNTSTGFELAQARPFLGWTNLGLTAFWHSNIENLISSVDLYSADVLGVVELGNLPTSDLVAYWDFEGQSLDQAPNGTQADDATLSGATITSIGLGGNAVQFDSPTDIVTVPTSVDINNPTSFVEQSVSFWFLPDDSTARQVLYQQGDATTGLNIYLENGKLYAGAWNDVAPTNWAGTWLSQFNVVDGQWNHVTFVLDTADPVAGLKLYLNGYAEPSGPASSMINHDPATLGAAQTGTRFDDGAGGFVTSTNAESYSGILEEVRVYDRAITTAETQDLLSAMPSQIPNIVSGLVAHWDFDGDANENAFVGAQVDDAVLSSSNSSDASLVGGGWDTGTLQFGGFGVMEVPTSPDVNSVAFTEKSIALWFNPSKPWWHRSPGDLSARRFKSRTECVFAKRQRLRRCME